jgi:Zn-dependent protease with chaperone function
MAGTTNFVAAQEANRRNTMILLAGLTLLAVVFGYLIGWVLQSEITDEVPLVSQAGLVAAGAMGAASLGWSGSRSPSATDGAAMAEPREITRKTRRSSSTWSRRCVRAGVPMPTVRIMETDALNAFATGTIGRDHSR